MNKLKIILLFSALYTQVSAAQTPKDYLESSSKLIELGKLDSALIICEKAITTNPNQAKLYGQRGAILMKLGRYSLALSDLTTAIKMGTNNSSIYYNRALLKEYLYQDEHWSLSKTEKRENLTKILNDYEQVLDIIPNDKPSLKKIKPIRRKIKKTYRVSEDAENWTNFRTVLHTGIGFHSSLFTEVGIARHKFIHHSISYGSKDYYLSLEYTPSFNKEDVYGLKIGYEIGWTILTCALEAKYQTNITNKDLVITPKVGFGVMGTVNLYYGYNFSTNNSPFQNIGHHQISLIINFKTHVYY